MITNIVNNLNEIENIIISLPKDTVIAEMSGRDSVAAMIKALERDDINTILPIASFAGIEVGDTSSIIHNNGRSIRRIRELYGDKKEILPVRFYSRPELWSSMNGKFIGEIVDRFGMYTPCIGCHFYFHILRVPFALKLGKKIVTGEKTIGKKKISQLDIVVDSYTELLSEFGVELVHPVRSSDEEEIKRYLGGIWPKGINNPKCPFGGSATSVTTYEEMYDVNLIEKYLNEFLIPYSRELLKTLITSPNAIKKDFNNIGSTILRGTHES